MKIKKGSALLGVGMAACFTVTAVGATSPQSAPEPGSSFVPEAFQVAAGPGFAADQVPASDPNALTPKQIEKIRKAGNARYASEQAALKLQRRMITGPGTALLKTPVDFSPDGGDLPSGDAAQSVARVTSSGDAMANREMAALKDAFGLIGKPYVFGAEGPDAWDCSGLVQDVYGRHGISVPRTADEQWHALNPIEKRDAVPGDLVFWFNSNGWAHHVGMYVGDNMAVEAANPHTGIVYRHLWGSGYAFATPRKTVGGPARPFVAPVQATPVPVTPARPPVVPVHPTHAPKPKPTEHPKPKPPKPTEHPAPKPTGTPTATPTASPTAPSPTGTPTALPTATPTPTAPVTGTPTATGTPTVGPTATGTPSSTATGTGTPTATVSPTGTGTPTGTPTATVSPTATGTPTTSSTAPVAPKLGFAARMRVATATLAAKATPKVTETKTKAVPVKVKVAAGSSKTATKTATTSTRPAPRVTETSTKAARVKVEVKPSSTKTATKTSSHKAEVTETRKVAVKVKVVVKEHAKQTSTRTRTATHTSAPTRTQTRTATHEVKHEKKSSSPAARAHVNEHLLNVCGSVGKNIHRGQDGYSSRRDPNHNGVACED